MGNMPSEPSLAPSCQQAAACSNHCSRAKPSSGLHSVKPVFFRRTSRRPVLTTLAALLCLLFVSLPAHHAGLRGVAAFGWGHSAQPPAEQLQAGLFAPNYGKMEPNATYHGIEGVFIPHVATMLKTTSTTTTTKKTTATTTTTTTTTTAPTTTTTTTTTSTVSTTASKDGKAVKGGWLFAKEGKDVDSASDSESDVVVAKKSKKIAESTSGVATTVALVIDKGVKDEEKERVRAAAGESNTSKTERGFFGGIFGVKGQSTTTTTPQGKKVGGFFIGGKHTVDNDVAIVDPGKGKVPTVTERASSGDGVIAWKTSDKKSGKDVKVAGSSESDVKRRGFFSWGGIDEATQKKSLAVAGEPSASDTGAAKKGKSSLQRNVIVVDDKDKESEKPKQSGWFFGGAKGDSFVNTDTEADPKVGKSKITPMKAAKTTEKEKVILVADEDQGQQIKRRDGKKSEIAVVAHKDAERQKAAARRGEEPEVRQSAEYFPVIVIPSHQDELNGTDAEVEVSKSAKPDGWFKSVGMIFSNIPKQPLPAVDHQTREVKVDMYRDEPCVIGAYSRTDPDVFMELAGKASNETGAVARESFVTVVPRDNEATIPIFLSNTERTSMGFINIRANVVDSVNPNLAMVEVHPGRLDPPFNPRTNAYYIRVPENAKHFKLDFKTVNDRDARCTINGEDFYPAKGSVAIQIPPADSEAFTLTCYDATGRHQAKYVFDIVPQYGGETQLKELSIAGAPLTSHFDPSFAGPYTADMVRGAKIGGEEIEWTQIKAVPVSPNAILTVDGHPVNETTGYTSAWMRIPRGEKRRAVVSVRTPENPVSEDYIVDLNREQYPNAWYNSDSSLAKAGRNLGLGSLLMGAGSSADLLANSRIVQMFSTLGHIPLVPERFDSFSRNFHLMNFQPGPCDHVSVHVANGTYPGGYQTMSAAPGKYDGKTVQPYAFNIFGDLEQDFNRFRRRQGIHRRNRIDISFMDADDLAGLSALRLPIAAAMSEADTFAEESPSSSRKRLWFELSNGEKMDLDEIGEIPEALYTFAGGSWRRAPTPEANPEGRPDMSVQGRFWLNRFGTRGEQDQGAPVTSLRRLQALNEDQRHQIIQELEVARKAHESVTYYVRTLVVVMPVIAVILTFYAIIWFAYLQAPEPKRGHRAVIGADSESLSDSQLLLGEGGKPRPTAEGIRVPGCGLVMRPDFPSFLHPVRFTSLIFDIAFVGFVQGAAGVLLANTKDFDYVQVFGVQLSMMIVKGVGVVVLVGCLGYLIWGTTRLGSAASRMTFGPQFCEYHDNVMTHAKANWAPKWAKYVPGLTTLLNVELQNVAPIQMPADPSSQAVIFENNAHAQAEVAALSHYSQDGYNQIGACENNLLYQRDDDAIEVAINDGLYNSVLENSDRHNADYLAKYPDARLGRTSFVFQNAYGYPLRLNTILQLKHLTSLMQLMDNFPFWLPRDNCQMPLKDSYWTQLCHAGRGFFYEWAVNRFLLFFTLCGTMYFSNSNVTIAMILIIAFSAVNCAIRIPSTAATGLAKYGRDYQIWETEQTELQEAALDAKEAEQVWPFNEPGFAERFQQVRDRKYNKRWCGMYSHCRGLFGERIDPDQQPNHGFCRSPTYYVGKQLLFSSAMGDLVVFVVAMCVFLGRRTHAHPLLASGIPAVAVAVVGLVLLSCGSLLSVLGAFKSSAKAWAHLLCQAEVSSREIWGIGGPKARISHFFAQLVKLLSNDPTHNWQYPKADRTLRRFPIDQVNIISNELGMHLLATVGHSSRYLEMAVGDKNRLKVFKTLVTHGATGSGRNLLNTLPIQVPFHQLFRFASNNEGDMALLLNTDSPIARLVATIQIVNHGFRANAAGLPALTHGEHDSFLSLYANEEFLPSPGKLKLRRTGHTYSVRYDPENSQLVVRGPAIVDSHTYTLKTSSHQPNRQEMYQNANAPHDAVSEDSHYESVEDIHGSANAHCETPGTLRVDVPARLAPNLYKLIKIQSPNGVAIELNPLQIKVHYDVDCGEMFLRHEDFLLSPRAYQVSWFVQPKEPGRVNAVGTAVENGVVYFPYDGSSLSPDLSRWLTLRDENSFVIDIDPKQTDAYQFFLPEKQNGGIGNAVQTVVGRTKAMAAFISGEDRTGMMEEPVPCTVVQCVNPVERIYRVDPNFKEVHRVLTARIHEFRGRQKAIEADSASTMWPSLMRPKEYVKFWRRHSVNIVDDLGSIVDPLAAATEDDPMFKDQLKNVSQGEFELRALLSSRIDAKIQDLENQIEEVGVWIGAYNDSGLHTAQLERDIADWSLRSDAEAKEQNKHLSDEKKRYEQRCENFVFPCNVPGVLIARRPNLSAQFRVWSDLLQSWFLYEEGCDVSTPKAKARIGAVVHDVMQSLKYTLYSNEVPTANAYRSTLHYVVGSQTIRGLNCHWCPDTLRAHPACVRAWTSKKNNEGQDTQEPDYRQLPERIPCLLRLTPTALQILMPNSGDLGRDFSTGEACPWQQNTGLYVPLHAFQKFEIIRDAGLPTAAADPKPFEAMTTKLICRKNQRIPVDDGYVRRMEDDQIGNDITFDDDSGKLTRFLVQIGHTVPASEASEWPLDEVDPTAGSEEINVHPLTFCFTPAFADAWERAIQMAKLHAPHDYDGDFTIPRPHPEPTPLPDLPLPPVPVVVPPPAPPPPAPIPTDPIPTEREARKPTHAECKLYDGGFSDYRFDGQGVLYDETGNVVYKGGWKDGKRHGHGVYNFADGSGVQWRYEGEFVDDEPRGQAVLHLVDERKIQELSNLDAESPLRNTVVSFRGAIAPADKFAGDITGPADFPNAGLPRTLLSNLFESPAFKPDAETMRRDLTQVFAHQRDGDFQALSDYVSSLYTAHDGTIRVDADAVRTLLSRSHVLENFTQDVLAAGASRSVADPPGAYLVTNFLPHKTRWLRELDPATGQPIFFGRMSDGQIRLVDGSVYEGATLSSIPHGRGRFYNQPSTVRYEGAFDSGKPHGYGILDTGFSDSHSFSTYFGTFQRGARQGEGIQLSKNDDVYVRGTFENDKLANGITQVVLRKKYAEETGAGFVSFKGPISNTVPHGKDRAEVEYVNGYVYSGQFSDGLRNGMGTIRNPEGLVVFSGMFKNDVPEGACSRCVYQDGTVYCGDMSNGSRQGIGELHKMAADGSPERAIYEGYWFGDRPHGRGVYCGDDGEYDGEWKDGKRHGKGRFIFSEHPLSNGRSRVYEGDWDRDVPHGIGKYLSEDAAENVYMLERGKIVDSSKSAYKPFCGRVPDIKVEPTVKPAEFRTNVEAATPWNRKLTSFNKQRFAAVIQNATATELGWKSHEHMFKFVHPRQDIPLLEVARREPPSPGDGPSQFPPTQLPDLRPSVLKPVMKLYIVEGRNLATGEKNEAYVKVKYGSSVKRTKGIKNAGPNPKFNKTLMFPAEGGIGNMTVEVWGQDTLGKDDLIGKGVLSLRKAIDEGEQCFVVVNLSKKQADAGSIVVSIFDIKVSEEMHINDASSQDTSNSLYAGRGPHASVTIHSVTRIESERGSEVAPFVRVELGPKAVSTATGSGLNIAYDETMYFALNGYTEMKFILLDQSKKESVILGQATVDINAYPQFSGELDLKRGSTTIGKIDCSVSLRDDPEA